MQTCRDGITAQAVDRAVRIGGVSSHFSAAGNSGRSSWEGAFRDSGMVGMNGGKLHDFDGNGNTFQALIYNSPGRARASFQWDEPFASVSGPPGSQVDVFVNFFFEMCRFVRDRNEHRLDNMES